MLTADCPFTAEDRINGGKRAAEVRRQEKAELIRLREWFAQLNAKEELKLKAEVAATQPLDIVRVREKLDKLDEAMNTAQTDKAWDAYSRAYERMFRVWCTLTKTPGPGNLKPSAARPRTPAPAPVPLLAEPVSSPAQAVEPQAGEAKS